MVKVLLTYLLPMFAIANGPMEQGDAHPIVVGRIGTESTVAAGVAALTTAVRPARVAGPKAVSARVVRSLDEGVLIEIRIDRQVVDRQMTTARVLGHIAVAQIVRVQVGLATGQILEIAACQRRLKALQ